MNISKILALRYIKRQKRRTVITILGIMLAVALFTSIAIMFDSMQHFQLNQYINSTGDYDVIYDGLNLKDIEYLKSNYSVDKIGTMVNIGNAFLRQDEISKYNSGDRTVRAYQLLFYQNDALKIRNIKLQKGKFANHENEAVVSEMFMKQGYKLNDKIKLYIVVNDLNKIEEKEFFISGFLNSSGNLIYVSQKAADSIMGGKESYSVYVSLKSKADFKKSFKTIESEIKPKFKSYNESVLALRGKSMGYGDDSGELIVMIVLGMIILISSALVIYSAFNMSIFQRIREFGMLRAVGASTYHIKNIVFIEALIMIGIGIPMGILCGIAAIKVIFFIMNISKFSIFNNMGVYISLKSIILCTAFGILCIIFSSIVPVVKSSRITPMEAIKGYGKNNGFTKNKKHRGIIKKKLKFETFLTFRNIKRNKKRFRLVVSSVVVSIVIFVSFYSVLNKMLQNINYDQCRKDFHIYSNDINFKKEDMYDLKRIKGVREVYPLEESSPMIFCPKDRLSPEFKKSSKSILNYSQGYFYDVNNILTGYDLNEINTLRDSVISGEINIEKINSGEEVLIFDGTNYTDSGKTVKETNLKPGDEIYIDGNRVYHGSNNTKIDYKKIDFKKLRKVRVGAILSKEISYYKNLRGISVIASLEGYKNITGLEGLCEFQVELEKNANRKKVKDEINNKLGINYKYGIDDSIEMEEEYRQYKMEAFVLIYGFIAVICSIGILNIINTVNTNLMLRLKEFACLRAVGMSTENLKKVLLKEGFLYGTYGILYGTILSSILYYIICKGMNNDVGMVNWTLFAKEIAGCSVAVFIIIFLSMIVPIKKIQKMNVVEIIRGEE